MSMHLGITLQRTSSDSSAAAPGESSLQTALKYTLWSIQEASSSQEPDDESSLINKTQVHLCVHRGEAFAKAYEESMLKRENDEELDAALQQRSTLNKDTLKELSVTQATVTPFWWALYVMFKVRC